METIKLGNMIIDLVEENTYPEISPYAYFPAIPEGSVEENIEWLRPMMDCTFDPWVTLGTTHAWVVRTGNKVIVIDTCLGNDKSRPAFGEAADHLHTPFIERFEALGVTPDDVDYVLHTHLHLDHVGWDTKLVDGKWVPTFPNAKYIYGRKDYEFREYMNKHGLNTGELGEEGVFEDSIKPIVDAGLADFADDGFVLDLGDARFEMVLADGHSFGHMVIRVVSNGETGVFVGDATHFPIQVKYPEASSIYCINQEEASKSRRRIFDECADNHSLIIASHWPEPCCCAYIVRDGESYRLESI